MRKRMVRAVAIKAPVIPAPNIVPMTTRAQPPTSMACMIWDAAAAEMPSDPAIHETAKLAPKMPTTANAAAAAA